MKFSSRLVTLSMRAIAALPFMFGLHTSAVAAPSAPAAMTTLDVCHNQVTGNWRYSGMAAVSGAAVKQSSSIGVDFWVQNSTSSTGYVNALHVPGDKQGIPTSSATARWVRFDMEAAPLPLGMLRNSARIAITDPLTLSTPPLLLHASAEFAEAVCGCQHIVGCTRTQGYWKSKPGVLWPAPRSRDLMFFSSGLTWQQILETPPKGGNAYLILAHQYIAAVLNRASGASAPSSLRTIITNATAWFSSGTNLDSCNASDCENQKNWAGLLDTYNNGLYPGATGHCPD